jgi:carbon-monoxide dehydrogenase medium subunit
VFRATAFEQALAREWSAKALDGVAQDADGLNADLHASPSYRAHLVGVLARRGVEAAV